MMMVMALILLNLDFFPYVMEASHYRRILPYRPRAKNDYPPPTPEEEDDLCCRACGQSLSEVVRKATQTETGRIFVDAAYAMSGIPHTLLGSRQSSRWCCIEKAFIPPKGTKLLTRTT
jgi:hypothetical protein